MTISLEGIFGSHDIGHAPLANILYNKSITFETFYNDIAKRNSRIISLMLPMPSGRVIIIIICAGPNKDEVKINVALNVTHNIIKGVKC